MHSLHWMQLMWNGHIQILNIFNKQQPPNLTGRVNQVCSHFDHICFNMLLSLIARHTLSVTVKSGDRVGQVVLKILLSVFDSREHLSTVWWCMSSLNIKKFPQNLLQQKAINLHPKFAYTFENQSPITPAYYWTSVWVKSPFIKFNTTVLSSRVNPRSILPS